MTVAVVDMDETTVVMVRMDTKYLLRWKGFIYPGIAQENIKVKLSNQILETQRNNVFRFHEI